MPSLPPTDLIPPDGLREVLSGWSGRGLLSVIAALPPSGELLDRDWRAADVVSRARRTLLSYLSESRDGNDGLICRLPAGLQNWLDVIPAAALRHRRVDTAPFRGVDWVTTRRLHGWPPSAFSGRVRHRVSDDALLAPAVWVLDRLSGLTEHLATMPPDLYRSIAPRLRAVGELLEHETVRQVMPGQRPNSENFAMLKNEGAPWSTVAEIGRQLSAVEDDPLAMATLVLFPDEAIAWRLFHLACFGEVLLALRQAGYKVVSRRPLSGDSAGPAYEAGAGSRTIDVWFEAAGAWKYYDIPSPYRAAVPCDGKPLGADILLRSRDGTKALVIECKYYLNNPQLIPRNGYMQALAYAAEATGRLATRAGAIAVGPTRLVPWSGSTSTSVGTVYVTSHCHLRSLVAEFGAE